MEMPAVDVPAARVVVSQESSKIWQPAQVDGSHDSEEGHGLVNALQLGEVLVDECVVAPPVLTHGLVHLGIRGFQGQHPPIDAPQVPEAGREIETIRANPDRQASRAGAGGELQNVTKQLAWLATPKTTERTSRLTR